MTVSMLTCSSVGVRYTYNSTHHVSPFSEPPATWTELRTIVTTKNRHTGFSSMNSRDVDSKGRHLDLLLPWVSILLYEVQEQSVLLLMTTITTVRITRLSSVSLYYKYRRLYVKCIILVTWVIPMTRIEKILDSIYCTNKGDWMHPWYIPGLGVTQRNVKNRKDYHTLTVHRSSLTWNSGVCR